MYVLACIVWEAAQLWVLGTRCVYPALTRIILYFWEPLPKLIKNVSVLKTVVNTHQDNEANIEKEVSKNARILKLSSSSLDSSNPNHMGFALSCIARNCVYVAKYETSKEAFTRRGRSINQTLVATRTFPLLLVVCLVQNVKVFETITQKQSLLTQVVARVRKTVFRARHVVSELGSPSEQSCQPGDVITYKVMANVPATNLCSFTCFSVC